MSRVLFYQSERLQDEDYVLVDGQRKVHEVAGEEMRQLLSLAHQALRHPEPWIGSFGDCYFIKGFLDAEDELGRRMTFMYMMPKVEGDKEVLHQKLINDLALSGKHLDVSTEKAMQDCKKSWLKRNVGRWLEGKSNMLVLSLALLPLIAFVLHKCTASN